MDGWSGGGKGGGGAEEGGGPLLISTSNKGAGQSNGSPFTLYSSKPLTLFPTHTPFLLLSFLIYFPFSPIYVHPLFPALFPSDLFVSFIPISSCHEICLHPSSPSSFFRSVYTLYPQIFQIGVHPLFLHCFIFLCALFLSKYLFSLFPHTFYSLYKKHTYFF